MGISVAWLSAQKCTVSFQGDIPSREAIGDAANFRLEAQSGASMTVYRSSPSEAAGITILHVGPSVLPEQTYLLHFGDQTAIVEIPVTIVPQASPEWSHGMLDALTETFGEAVQRYSGKPQTLVVSNFKNTDTKVYVESTLGFPAKGRLFIKNRMYSYTSKSAMSFNGVTPEFYYNQGFPPQTMVTCDVDSIFPS